MTTVILVIHIMVAAALVGLVLLQRSEGGALGIGGGGGSGGFMTGRGTANLLTRVTAVLAAAFFVTSILLTLLAQKNTGPGTGLENFTIQGDQGKVDEKPASPLEGLKLPTQEPKGPQVPQSQ